MIEKTILDYLSACLDVPVHMEVPEKPPGCFVVVEKTGSGQENMIYSAMLAIQSYAESMYQAAALNEKVKEAMAESVTLAEISRCRLNTDYNYTDQSTKRYRYQAVFDLVYLE